MIDRPPPDTDPAAPAGRDGFDWRHPSFEGIVFLLLLVVGLRIGLQPLGDNSFLTHLATGRLIFENGSVPSVDPYSFTAHGDPWTVQSWLASVVYAGIERTVGLVGIRVLNAAVVLALVTVLWRLARPAGSLIGRAVAVGLVVCMGTGLWVERPLLFGALFLGLVLLAAEDRLDPRWLVPVMWVWANVHGSFPFGIGYLVLVAAGRWLDDRDRPRVELRALAWAGLGTALAAIGPIGPKLLLFPVQLLSKREAFSGIVEWEPPHWHRGVERFFAFQMILLLALLLLRHRKWRAILPAVVFGLAAASSTRNILQASLVATPLLAVALAGLGRIDGTRRPRLIRPVGIALAVLLGLVALTSLQVPSTALEPYPEEAGRWMRAEGLLDLDDRVVSRDFVGNYLEFAYGPDDVRVYFDDRVDMYPQAVIDQYTVLLRSGGGDGRYQRALDGAGATAVLWERDTRLGRWLMEQDRWDVVYRDDKWLVAVPVGG